MNYVRYVSNPLMLNSYLKRELLLLLFVFIPILFLVEIPNFVYIALLVLLIPNRSESLVLGSFFLITYTVATHDLSFFILPTSIILSFFLGGWLVVLIHGTSHNSIKPRFFNNLVGECVGLFFLSGLFLFYYIHYFHHKFSDIPEKDPHAIPPDTRFWKYVFIFPRAADKLLERNIRELFSGTSINEIFVFYIMLISRILRVVILFLMLGEVIFSLIYIPSLLFAHWLFIYINYYSHPNDRQKRNSIVDLERTTFQKLINLAFMGLLLHGSHHKNPLPLNPRPKS